jgi:hypothetical protein
MNPHLVAFFKKLFWVLAASVIALIAYRFLAANTSIDLNQIGSLLLYGFFGLLMAGMLAMLLAVTLKAVFTAIMARSEFIFYCCEDMVEAGIHIVTKHYFPGGKATKGYTAYYHYYLPFDSGTIFMSKRLNNEADLGQSTKALCATVGKSLQPNLLLKHDVGPYEGSGNQLTVRNIQLKSGTITFEGFNNIYDYGFRVAFKDNSNNLRWRSKI